MKRPDRAGQNVGPALPAGRPARTCPAAVGTVFCLALLGPVPVGAAAILASTAPLPPPRPALPALPEPGPARPALPQPLAAPPPTTPPPPAPDAAAAPDCLARLATARVTAERVAPGPQPDPRCIVENAVRVTGLSLPDGRTIAFPDHPVIACATASTFASFVRDLLAPLAKGSYGAALDAVWTGPGLECRTRDHVAGAKLSAHGQGLAIDIAQVRLSDKRVIEVGRPKADGDRAFETAALAGGCGYFHTALGPGADAFHETHWHFDLLPRGAKGEAKLCQGE